MLRPQAVDVPSGAVGRIHAVVPLQLERTVQQLRVRQGGELALLPPHERRHHTGDERRVDLQAGVRAARHCVAIAPVGCAVWW
eukprot:2203590-Prymnesium_polylepis.1